MMILSPSLLAADFKNLEKDIKAVDEAGANTSILMLWMEALCQAFLLAIQLIKSIRECTDKVFDVHLYDR